jgi:hypothetical protein
MIRAVRLGDVAVRVNARNKDQHMGDVLCKKLTPTIALDEDVEFGKIP